MNLPVDVLCRPITEWSINHAFLSPLPFLLCLCSSGVWQRDAALSERRHVPPPSTLPLLPRLHGHPVWENSLPGSRRLRWPIVWTGLAPSSPHRPPPHSYPCSVPAIIRFPLLRDLNQILNQNMKCWEWTLNLKDMKNKECVDNVLSRQYKQLFFVYPRPQWWMAVLLAQMAVHWCVILNDRRIYERSGEITAVL